MLDILILLLYAFIIIFTALISITMHAYIFNIQRFSIHDGPGIRTTVFFQGCPLQCAWCHNPEGIPQYLEGAKGYHSHSAARKYSIDDLMEEILKDQVFYDESGGGVTFSGGEPLMQTEFLLELLKKLKEKNINTAIDTSGYAPVDIFRDVVERCDLVLFDLKIIDNGKHKLYTGTGNSLIHKNLKYLQESGKAFRIRIPLVNGITASEENLDGICAMLEKLKPVEIDLLSYHDLGRAKENNKNKKGTSSLTAPDGDRFKEIMEKFMKLGHNVNVGG